MIVRLSPRVARLTEFTSPVSLPTAHVELCSFASRRRTQITVARLPETIDDGSGTIALTVTTRSKLSPASVPGAYVPVGSYLT